MKRWINWNHLKDANTNYFTHLYWGLREAIFLFIMAFASILHAIFPPLFNFKLLEIRVHKIMAFYKHLPQHPVWKEVKVTFIKDYWSENKNEKR